MEQQKEYLKHEGIIIGVEANTKNGPKGFIYFEENGQRVKYTCWSQSILDSFEEGDEVIVTYTIQENNYQGRQFMNKVISRIEFKNKGEVPFSEKEREIIKEVHPSLKIPKTNTTIKSENGVIKMGGLFYRIKNIEVEQITNGNEDSI
jgi:hypothetical protein